MNRILEISEIKVADRLRPVDPNTVEALAASISESGRLEQPIIVRPDPDGNGCILVAGAHRLAAVKRLGWVDVPAIMHNISADEARIVEIDENLIRRELTALDRAIFLSERKAAYEAANPETQWGKAPKSRKSRNESKVANLATLSRFSKDAAEKTGLSERSIRRAAELIKALDPSAVALLRLSEIGDNASQLKALAQMPAEQQRTAAKLIAERGIKTLSAAKDAAGLSKPAEKRDPEEVALARVLRDIALLGAKSLDRVIETAQFALKAKRRASKQTEGNA